MTSSSGPSELLLGGGVANRGDRLDEIQLLVDALADLDAPHALALNVLAGPAPDDEGCRCSVRYQELAGRAWSAAPRAWL